MNKRSSFPAGNLRRRTVGNDAIYVCTIWLRDSEKRAFDEMQRLERELYPEHGDYRYDDALTLSSMVTMAIKEKLDRLRESKAFRMQRFRRLAHGKLCQGAT